MIRIAWRPAIGRASLSEPISCEVAYHFDGLKETQNRLLGEIQGAIRQLLDRQRSAAGPTPAPRILSFRQPR